MSSLPVCLIGGFRITHRGIAGTKITLSLKTMLAYLLLNRRQFHLRELLVGLFWGEHSGWRPRTCLSSSLWRLHLDWWSEEERLVRSGFQILATALR
ncbi:MAG: hypothetical protein PVF44_11060 [Syntrophobacterales bacterium]